jgi:hypothetical protein
LTKCVAVKCIEKIETGHCAANSSVNVILLPKARRQRICFVDVEMIMVLLDLHTDYVVDKQLACRGLYIDAGIVLNY